MFTINNVKFASFSQDAEVAFLHTRQRGENVQVRAKNGTLLADFVPNSDGTTSIFATDVGKPFVEALA